ncbi:MAG: SpoIID/LytB domain-containing protein [Spirochaetes bacterium]|jgi:stage II sporulation protein D|nr:SpoIID/LytB domain-containing protein [Spirochaetota bacterium]
MRYVVFCKVIALILLITACTPSKKYLEQRGELITDKSSFIRVLLLKTDAPITVGSVKRMKVKNLKSGKLLMDGNGKKVKFFADKLTTPVIIESWSAPLVVNNKPYRGMIELHNVTGKIYVINVVKMESYIMGVVSSEMSPSWHTEAIKAQAVAARTYAFYTLSNKKTVSLYDLDATTKFQVYKGMSAESENSNNAVKETTGQILSYNNKPILALFHSTSGGRIINNKYVWNGEDLPYLVDKAVPYGKSSPHYSWSTQIGLYEIRKLLDSRYTNVGAVTGLSFKKHQGRVVEIIITHKNGRVKMSGNEFRMMFPGGKIKSQFFTAKRTKDGLHLDGHGWGHGVGMCQYSAKEMAELGKSYKDILNFFYEGITITTF